MIEMLKKEEFKIMMEIAELRIHRDSLMNRMCKNGKDDAVEDEFFEYVQKMNRLDQDLFDIQYQIVHGNH